MRFALPALVIATMLGAAPAVNAGQPPQQSPPGGAAGMGPHGGMHGGGCLAMSDERLEAVKRELGVTAAQTPAWNTFAEAVRANAREMGQMMGQMGPSGAAGQPGMTLPQRMDMHERMMTQRLDALRRVKATLLPLYESFTPAQKAKADAMCGPHGMGPKKP